MKTKDFKNLKDNDLSELVKLVKTKKLELIKNQVKLTSSKEKNVKIGKILRKEIAQILSLVKTKK